MEPSTNTSSETEIVACEARLRQAMLRSEVEQLDRLLAPELIFTNHLGQLMTKQDDLAAHRSRTLNIESLVPSEETIRVFGEVAIVSVRVEIVGTYAGVASETDLRFTRVWRRSSSAAWQVVAAHSSAVI